MRYRKMIISLFAATVMLSASASANVGTGMNAWFDSMGGFTNPTPPSSYKGQTQNGYSAGGFYARTPVKTYQLASMTPPSLDIGCGGIDLTAGSFSFINKAALTSLFKNIGTSISYAFLLAIKSSMPEMASLFEYLQDVANKVNSLNVNSCKMAEGIPALLGPDLSKSSSDMFGHVAGSISNMLPDSYDAWKSSRDSAAAKRLAEDAAIAIDPTKKEQYRPGNVIWQALGRTTGLDTQDKLLIMSMTGTIVIDPPNPAIKPAQGGSSATWRYVEPTGIDVNDFIGYNDGAVSSVSIMQCDTAVDCLNPTPSTTAVTPFINLIGAKINAMRDQLLTRSPQVIANFKLVDASSIPVWKMISTSADTNPGFVETYKKLIAVDVAYAYVNNLLTTATQVISNSQSGSVPQDAQDALSKLHDRLDVLKTVLNTTRLAEYSHVQQEADLERQIQLMHQTMVAGIPAQAFTSMAVFN